jgi:hypothetical protein
MLEDREAKRDVRNKHTVHNVDMQPVGLTMIEHIDVPPQMGEIGREE